MLDNDRLNTPHPNNEKQKIALYVQEVNKPDKISCYPLEDCPVDIFDHQDYFRGGIHSQATVGQGLFN